MLHCAHTLSTCDTSSSLWYVCELILRRVCPSLTQRLFSSQYHARPTTHPRYATSTSAAICDVLVLQHSCLWPASPLFRWTGPLLFAANGAYPGFR